MQDTKARILTAAEKLFIEKGIDGASLRAITAEAGANIAAINYHFGSKDNLVQEVFIKFLMPLDELREKLLKEAEEEKEGKYLSVKDLVRAFLIPWFKFKTDHPQIMNIFIRFYGLQTGVTDSNFRTMVHDTAKSAYSIFSEGVFYALPDVEREKLVKRINMAVITAASFIINGWMVKSLETLSGSSIDQASMIDYVVGMIEKGVAD